MWGRCWTREAEVQKDCGNFKQLTTKNCESNAFFINSHLVTTKDPRISHDQCNISTLPVSSQTVNSQQTTQLQQQLSDHSKSQIAPNIRSLSDHSKFTKLHSMWIQEWGTCHLTTRDLQLFPYFQVFPCCLSGVCVTFWYFSVTF